MEEDNISRPSTGGRFTVARGKEDEEKNYLLDIAAAPIRGLEGGAQGLYNFADFLTGDDLLPDYDTRLFGRSNTIAGGLVEGVSQFLTGFIPGLGVLGKAGRLTTASRSLGRPLAGALARGKKLDYKSLRKVAKTKGRALDTGKDIAAGIGADLLMFNGQEERLSNLIEEYPSLQNPITEFLKEDDDTEVEGRLKNVVEGLFMEAGIRSLGLATPFIKALRTIKFRNQAMAKGMDEVDATNEAMSRSELTEEDFDAAGRARNEAEMNQEVLDFGPERPLNLNADNLNTYLEAQGLKYSDFVIDDATGQPSLKTAGVGGRDATPQDIKNYIYESYARGSGRIAEGVIKGHKNVRSLVDALLEPNQNIIKENKKTESYLNLLKTLRNKYGDEMSQIAVFQEKKGTRAYYLDGSHSIHLENGDELYAVAHETVHGLSVKLIDKYFTYGTKGRAYLENVRQVVNSKEAPESIKQIGELYLDVVDQMGAKATIEKKVQPKNPDLTHNTGFAYGLGNISEFVAEALTNPSFQRELASITVKRDKQSAWSYFKSLVAKLLGFDIKNDSALAEVLSASQGLFRDQSTFLSKKRRGDGRMVPDSFGVYGGIMARSLKNPIIKDDIGQLEMLSTAGKDELKSKGSDYWTAAAERYGVKLTKAQREQINNFDETKFPKLTAKIIDAARLEREKTVEANLKKLDPKIFPALRLTAPTKVVTQADGTYFDVEVDGVVSSVRKDNYNYKTKKDAERRIIGSRKQKAFEEAKEEISSGRALRSALEGTDIKLTEQSMFMQGSNLSNTRQILNDASRLDEPNSVELIFTDKNGDIVEFADLPEKAQIQAELRLKADGGQIRGKFKENDRRIDKDPSLDPNQMEMNLDGAPPREPPQLPDKLKQDMEDSGMTIDTVREQEIQDLELMVNRLLSEGGEQAILSAARLARNDSEIATIAKIAAERRLADAKNLDNLPKTSKEELLKEASTTLERIGGNRNDYEAKVNEAVRKGEKLETIRAEQLELQRLNETIAADVQTKAQRARDAETDASLGDREVLVTEFLQSLDLLLASQRAWSNYGRNLSLGLLQRKFIYGKKTDSSFGVGDITNREEMARYRNEVRGTMSEKKLIDVILSANNAKDIEQGLKAQNELAKQTKGSKLMDITREVWVNSLLSAPTTQFVNLIGSQMTHILRNLERTVGSIAQGDFRRAYATMRYSFSANAVADAFMMANKAFATKEGVLTPNSRAFDDRNFNREAIRAEGDDAFSTAWNFLGATVRLPGRGLVWGDEIYKQLNYRTYLQTELAIQGMQRKLTGDNLAKYIKGGLDAYLHKGRSFNESNILKEANIAADKAGMKFAERDEFIENYLDSNNTDFTMPDGSVVARKDRAALAEKALDFAKQNTHTQDSENSIVRGLSKMAAENPSLTFVVPFVRTPTNLLSFGIMRSPFGIPLEVLKLRQKDYRMKYIKGSPAEKAEIYGRLSTAVATTAGLIWMFQSGQANEFITGYGPKDKATRKAWEMNKQQYSVKIGDKWVSYNRLDPVATMLGIIADIREAQDYNDFEDDDLSTLFGVLALSLANNVTNKSYVQGIDNLFNFLKEPQNNAQKFFGSIAGGFVPNIINQGMNFEENRELKETRTLLDYMMKRFPGTADKLPPRRNFLGEVETIETSGGLSGFLNPLYMKDISTDVVDMEFSNLGRGFSNPSFYARDGVKELDMREYYGEDGQQAYDRMLELVGTNKINGRTLRQNLSRMFKDPRYQALPDTDMKADTGTESPKIREIRKLMRAYRSVAKRQVLKEYPELNQRYQQALRDSRSYSTPQN